MRAHFGTGTLMLLGNSEASQDSLSGALSVLCFVFISLRRAAAGLLWSILLFAPIALAGGPKYVAGVSFFNPAVLG